MRMFSLQSPGPEKVERGTEVKAQPRDARLPTLCTPWARRRLPGHWTFGYLQVGADDRFKMFRVEVQNRPPTRFDEGKMKRKTDIDQVFPPLLSQAQLHQGGFRRQV